MKYQRPQEDLLKSRLSEPVHFINLLAGPRQVGKTTIIRDIISLNPAQGYYISVDDEPAIADDFYSLNTIPSIVSPPQKKDGSWLQFHWQEARNRTAKWLKSGQTAKKQEQPAAFVFAIDEVQKIEQWSDIVKLDVQVFKLFAA